MVASRTVARFPAAASAAFVWRDRNRAALFRSGEQNIAGLQTAIEVTRLVEGLEKQKNKRKITCAASRGGTAPCSRRRASGSRLRRNSMTRTSGAHFQRCRRGGRRSGGATWAAARALLPRKGRWREASVERYSRITLRVMQRGRVADIFRLGKPHPTAFTDFGKNR